MSRTMILYRGSLKSCNYRCSYCPFSKHRMSEMELEQDREQWLRFGKQLLDRAARLNIHALMVVPYGEALIHPWYWEGLAAFTASDDFDAAGAQTNLSFSVQDALERFLGAGGKGEKLRLWATFHPEMTSVEAFAEKCIQLTKAGIVLCAGAVGVPEHTALLKKLRQALPRQIYLWINQMDGRKRPYTKQEQSDFLEIDPFFLQELIPVPGDSSHCKGRLFVEGNGAVRTCNIGPVLKTNWYELDAALPEPVCRRKLCSCYLAYGGRRDFMNQILFGPYPLFRVPRRPKAVFLDIDGTLIPAGTDSVPARTAKLLTTLVKTQGSLLFFATSLPYEEAMKRCRDIRHLFGGGIFAGGAHILFAGGSHPADSREFCESYISLPEECMTYLEPQRKRFRFRILTCRKNACVYKLTLRRSAHMPWSKREAETLFSLLPEAFQKTLRYFTEANCLQIVDAKASKANGVRTLCRWLNLPLSDIAAAGDSEEDREMLNLGL